MRKIGRNDDGGVDLFPAQHVPCLPFIGDDADQPQPFVIIDLAGQKAAVGRMFLIADDRWYFLDDAGVIEDAEEDQIGRCSAEEKDGPPGIVEKGVGQFPAYQCNKSHYDRAPFRLRAIAPAVISRNVFMP